MNWITTLRGVLGKFWTWLFYDRDFILGVQNVHALIGLHEQSKVRNNLICQDIEDKTPLCGLLPRPLYIDNATIGKRGYTIEEIFSGLGTFTDHKTSGSEWTAATTAPVGEPYMLTDHVVDYTTALFRGIDFECRDDEFIFRMDPDDLNLRTLKRTDVDGTLCIYRVIWAWYREDDAEKDAVRGLVTSGAGKYAEEVWKIRHEGATKYNTKALLAKVSGSVVSDVNGKVADIWVEQDYRHMLVAGKVYSAPVSAAVNKAKGSVVNVGDVLFGSLKFFSGSDNMSAADVPGIRITTDVGGLVARNTDGVNVTNNTLPLNGSADLVSAYVEEMASRNNDPVCPKCTLPATLNPLKYITQAVRRGRSCIAVLTADKMQDVAPALKALRDNTCASAIVDVVVKASAEDVFDAFTLEAEAEVGNGAIAVSVTPLEAENSVSVEVWR